MPFSLATRNVSCSRGDGLQVLEVTTCFEQATLNVLYGSVGSGNALLLRLLALMEVPDAGEVAIDGNSTLGWTETQRTDMRSHHFGFVFGAPFLLPSLTVIENIAMPLFKLTGIRPEEARVHTERVLEFVDLPHCAEWPSGELPLWTQLRISLARALVTTPDALFVEKLDRLAGQDEQTGFMDLLGAVPRTFGTCVLATAVCTEAVCVAGRALEMREGRVVRDWNPGGYLS